MGAQRLLERRKIVALCRGAQDLVAGGDHDNVPDPVLGNARIEAPGYKTVELGDIDLTNGLVILDVELEPL